MQLDHFVLSTDHLAAFLSTSGVTEYWCELNLAVLNLWLLCSEVEIKVGAIGCNICEEMIWPISSSCY